jgi:hypothetical protein
MIMPATRNTHGYAPSNSSLAPRRARSHPTTPYYPTGPEFQDRTVHSVRVHTSDQVRHTSVPQGYYQNPAVEQGTSCFEQTPSIHVFNTNEHPASLPPDRSSGHSFVPTLHRTGSISAPELAIDEIIDTSLFAGSASDSGESWDPQQSQPDYYQQPSNAPIPRSSSTYYQSGYTNSHYSDSLPASRYLNSSGWSSSYSQQLHIPADSILNFPSSMPTRGYAASSSSQSRRVSPTEEAGSEIYSSVEPSPIDGVSPVTNYPTSRASRQVDYSDSSDSESAKEEDEGVLHDPVAIESWLRVATGIDENAPLRLDSMREAGTDKKPDAPYPVLAALAIWSSPERKLKLKDIISSFKSVFPFFLKEKKSAWEASSQFL